MDERSAALLASPSGARFRRVALQVNPFPYVVRSGREHEWSDADAYNRDLVDALVAADVEMIGITDHDHADDAGLLVTASAAGIVAFPGVELCSSEQVHVCALFDPSVDKQVIDDLAGWAEVDRQPDTTLRPCRKPLMDILRYVRDRGGVTFLPHSVHGCGLFAAMSGQQLAAAWADPDVVAVAIPSTVEAIEEHRVRQILLGREQNFPREHPIAILNAGDVCGPDDVHPGAWSSIKTATDTIDGLRQAFLDPESRIGGLGSEPGAAVGHNRIVGLSWSGGFLDGVDLHLNAHLNVLIGGRGAGKSTIIESLRWVLGVEVVGETATEQQAGILDEVLGHGASVTAIVESTSPDVRRYRITRDARGGAARVTDLDGHPSDLAPSDLLPHVEVYGQHELAELARRPEDRVRLIRRHLAPGDGDAELIRIRRLLTESRKRLDDVGRQHQRAITDLTSLRQKQEEVERFEAAGVEERLQRESEFDQDEHLLERARQTLADGLLPLVAQLEDASRPDITFLRDDVVGDQPSATTLRTTREILHGLHEAMEPITSAARTEVESRLERLAQLTEVWTTERAAARQAYEQALQQLGNEADYYVQLRREVTTLDTVTGRVNSLTKELAGLLAEREGLLDELGQHLGARQSSWSRAGKRANRALDGVVRVDYDARVGPAQIVEIVRGELGGRLDVFERAMEARPVDPRAFVRATDDVDDLAELLGVEVSNQLQRVVDELGRSSRHRIEELVAVERLDVAMNLGTVAEPQWRAIESLSTGQRATALLLLVLLDADSPLIIDQPEDDLDNAFITSGVVPQLRTVKQRRQVLLSTHNANLPVLADAELIATLRPDGDADGGRATIPPEALGSIDSPGVRATVSELLEGGRQAFDTRRRKYGF